MANYDKSGNDTFAIISFISGVSLVIVGVVCYFTMDNDVIGTTSVFLVLAGFLIVILGFTAVIRKQSARKRAVDKWGNPRLKTDLESAPQRARRIASQIVAAKKTSEAVSQAVSKAPSRPPPAKVQEHRFAVAPIVGGCEVRQGKIRPGLGGLGGYTGPDVVR